MANEVSSIGNGISIRGDVSGSEALSVEGRIEGRVQLSHELTVEPTGQLEADVWARRITVHGAAHGHLEAEEKILVSALATVTGTLRAPCVVIEDGAHFSGQIEMDVAVG